MGGLISLLRDIKTVYKDLKVTLKLTARIVLKVHSIVEDVEQTVQELKAAVKGLSSKVHPQDGTAGEVAFEALVESVESKAISLKLPSSKLQVKCLTKTSSEILRRNGIRLCSIRDRAARLLQISWRILRLALSVTK